MTDDCSALEAALLALPHDRPFRALDVEAAGVRPRDLRRLVAEGLLAHPMRDVYYVHGQPDTLALRVECMRLTMPTDGVVTDRIAGWLLGARMILPPGAHMEVPDPTVFLPPGRRLRNGIVASGERRLEARDVTRVHGVWVTTPLRTACDLGRLLHIDQALGAMDSLARIGNFSAGEVEREMVRFAGYRGVVQARALASMTDGRSGSPEESLLRLRWAQAGGLPRLHLQFAVPSPTDTAYYLDLAVPELGYAVEYDGEAWHGPERQSADAFRREWMAREYGFVFDVFTSADVHGRHEAASARLRRGVERARLTLPDRISRVQRLTSTRPKLSAG